MMRLWHHAFAVALFATAGCVTVDLDAAKQLAIGGKLAATTMKADIVQVAADYRAGPQRDTLLRVLALAANSNNLPITVAVSSYAELEKASDAIVARAAVFDSLAKLYDKLEKGTSNNAKTSTSNAFVELIAAVDGYRNALSEASASDLAGTDQANGLGRLAALFADYVQQQKMREASQMIRVQLVAVRKLLADERVYSASARKIIVLQEEELQDALRRAGLLDSSPLLDDIVTLSKGAKSATAAKAYTENKRLQEALSAYRRWYNANYRQTLVERSYDKSIEVFEALEEAHVAFELGQEPSLESLAALLQELRTISDLLEGGGDSDG